VKRSKRPYHHGDLRLALIDEAVVMLREVRPDALSMRELARRLDVSLAAPHHHFPEKDELFAAIAEAAFRELAARIAVNIAHETEPRAQLAVIARSYLEFAQAEPMRYRVMYLPQLADRVRFAALHVTGGNALELLSATFARAGVAKARTRAIVCWSTLHGFAMLAIDSLLPESGRALRTLTEDVIATASAV
jgi:AcrR family transcriptional regulator